MPTATLFTDAAPTRQRETESDRRARIAGERVEYHGVLVVQSSDGSWQARNVVSVIEYVIENEQRRAA